MSVMERNVRAFTCEVDGFTARGTVTRPFNSEICDYMVDLKVISPTSGQTSSYYFRMIMVATPPMYSINLIENRLNIGVMQKRIFVDIPKDTAAQTFEKGINFCVAYHKEHF